jgi:isoleucyl-tRNA synthetase
MDDDVYKMRQDQSVTVTFPLVGERAEVLGLTGVEALAWTTTPWTLPTNAALAVGPDIEYAVVRSADGAHEYLLAADTIGAYLKELGYETRQDVVVASTVRGAELEGVHYDRLWDHYADEAWGNGNAWQILVADYVATGEGTGIVHQAPAYGEDDQVTCTAAGIPVILSLDDGGRFLPSVPEVAGQHWFDANKPLTQLLRDSGRLFQQRSYEHSYPHCWRCRNPLIYKAVASWFVRVPEFRERMSELNQQITWVPENVKDGQFGKWLSNARDWSISRNRYWGSPIPVWKSDDPEYPRIDVYGSLDEIERDFGVRPDDLHRPVVDDLTRPNPDDPTGRSTMRRIPDVLDVWFDSGSMPFAQVHYPFENREWFESHSPADFIVEYIGQTRGWFYLLHVLSTALFDRPAFTNVLSHGIVLGNDGQKMSKSLRNYPDVSEVFDRDGADAMRWFLMSSSVIRGGNLVVTEEGIRAGVRELLLPLWSTYYFFTLYANSADGYTAKRRTDSTHVLDRYLLAKTGEVLEQVTQHLDDLDSPFAANALRDFGDVLTNWYVRRSRDRFWGGDDQDAFDTLFTVLETLCRMAAPLLPLVTEEIWRGLTGGRSVHLEDWPDPDEFPRDPELVASMDRVRDIASSGLALRKARLLRVRLPLAKLTVVASGADLLAPFEDVLRDELNVKSVEFVELTPDVMEEHGVTFRMSVDARAAGPRLGKKIQEIIRAVKNGEGRIADGTYEVAGEVLTADEFTYAPSTESPEISFLADAQFIVLDTHVTPELEAEGVARDVVRAVQQARKDAGLEVSDRISLVIGADAVTVAAILTHRELIATETLATALDAHEAEGEMSIEVERA